MKILKIMLFSIPGLVVGILIFLYIIGGEKGGSTKAIAGNMSESVICATTGYIIKKRLGSNFKVHSIPCSVKNIGGNKVEISSGYISPLGPTLYFTARGSASSGKLLLTEIKVHGVDSKFIPYNKFQQ